MQFQVIINCTFSPFSLVKYIRVITLKQSIKRLKHDTDLHLQSASALTSRSFCFASRLEFQVRMRFTVFFVILASLVAVMHIQRTDCTFKKITFGKAVKGSKGVVLASILSPKLLVLKSLLFKPIALLTLFKLKFALLLGKPAILITLKKLFVAPVIGGLLLKIPLIIKGAGTKILVKALALKLALVVKGLSVLKGPIVLLFIAASALGTGINLVSSLGVRGNVGTTAVASYAAAKPPVYQEVALGKPIGPTNYYQETAGVDQQIGPVNYSRQQVGQAIGATSYYQSNGRMDDYLLGGSRQKRATSEEDSDESDDNDGVDIRTEFEAARQNGDSFLYMASIFDEHQCGSRLICEVYQKPRESLSDDEMVLQEIFGYNTNQLFLYYYLELIDDLLL